MVLCTYPAVLAQGVERVGLLVFRVLLELRWALWTACARLAVAEWPLRSNWGLGLFRCFVSWIQAKVAPVMRSPVNLIKSRALLSIMNILPEPDTKYLCKYRISANSFRGNYSFLNLASFTVTFDLYFINLNSCRGNYSREETICGITVIGDLLDVRPNPLASFGLAPHSGSLRASGSQIGSSPIGLPLKWIKIWVL